jgi:hypothetical protein
VGGDPGEIQFVCVLVYDSYGTTTKLTLVFDQDIPGGLSASDIGISGTAAAAGGPERKLTGVYELAVNVTNTETITVTVNKTGSSITPASKTVDVQYAIPAVFQSVTDNGSPDTTGLTLQFDQDIVDLTEDDITLNAGSTGAVKGLLARTGTGTYALPLTGITAPGPITVTVNKTGYSIGPASLPVFVWYDIPPLVSSSFTSIREKFGVAEGTGSVTDTFNTLSAFISGGGLTVHPNAIRLNDWIDLDGGLVVEAYNGTDLRRYRLRAG